MADPEKAEKPYTECSEITRRGNKCTAPAVGGYPTCNFHMRGRAMEAAIKGNQSANRHQKTLREAIIQSADGPLEPPDLNTPEAIRQYVAQLIAEVKGHRITAQDAQMALYACSVALATMRVDRYHGGDQPVPEITEIEASGDPRATSGEYPGSEFGEGSGEARSN